VDFHLLLLDQVQKQIERPFENIEFELIGHGWVPKRGFKSDAPSNVPSNLQRANLFINLPSGAGAGKESPVRQNLL
jgi:hypothetical protein